MSLKINVLFLEGGMQICAVFQTVYLLLLVTASDYYSPTNYLYHLIAAGQR